MTASVKEEQPLVVVFYDPITQPFPSIARAREGPFRDG